jgi:hypothetical protein
MESNDRAGVIVAQPRSLQERNAVAARCCEALEISIPLVVDGLDDRVDEAYAAFPDRLYVIDRAGRVAYKGGRGPFGFDPREMETALILTLLEERERAF